MQDTGDGVGNMMDKLPGPRSLLESDTKQTHEWKYLCKMWKFYEEKRQSARERIRWALKRSLWKESDNWAEMWRIR